MEINSSNCFQIENITSTQDADLYGYSLGGKFYSVGFLPLMLCLGVLDNAAFMFVVSRVPRMHTPTNCYLMNLAIADTLFLLTGVSEKIYRYIKSPIQGDDTPIWTGGCLWIYLVLDSAYFASLWFVSLVSIERYCAVCRPQTTYIANKRKTGLLTLVAWITSIVLAAAFIPSTNTFVQICLLWPEKERYIHFPDSWGICTSSRPWIKAFADGLQTIPFFVTLVINLAMYVLIVRGLNNSVSRLKNHSERTRTTDHDTRMRDQITCMLVVNGVAFFICLAPFEILSCIDMVSSVRDHLVVYSSDVFTSFIYVARALLYINCAINPIIYTAMSQRYRRAFRQAFCRRKKAIPGQSIATKFIPSTTQDQLKMTGIDVSR